MISNESEILSKISSLASAFSSIGGFIAFVLDKADGAWDDYITFDTGKLFGRYI